MVPRDAGKSKVTSRRKVDKNEVEVRKEIDRSKEVEVHTDSRRNNMHLSVKEVKETIVNNVKRSLKPGASVGLISGTMQVINTLENEVFEPFADGGVLNASAGSVPNTILGLTTGETYYANASVAQGRAGLGDLASVGYSTLSAGAHAEYGLNNSVGANVSLIRVDGNVGPVQFGVGVNLDTHASAGVNGISASFLGMGFSVGPRLGIQTPFFDFSVTLF